MPQEQHQKERIHYKLRILGMARSIRATRSIKDHVLHVLQLQQATEMNIYLGPRPVLRRGRRGRERRQDSRQALPREGRGARTRGQTTAGLGTPKHKTAGPRTTEIITTETSNHDGSSMMILQLGTAQIQIDN